ncbi:unnamed protein product [Ectocarpus sp. 4 AP-2014]
MTGCYSIFFWMLRGLDKTRCCTTRIACLVSLSHIGHGALSMPPPLLVASISRRKHGTSPSLITCCWLTDAPTISIQNNAKKHHFGHISCARMLERGFVCHLSPLPEPPR